MRHASLFTSLSTPSHASLWRDSSPPRALLERVDDDEKTKALKLAQVPMPGVDLALAYLQQATSPTEEFQERVQELFTLYSSSEWK